MTEANSLFTLDPTLQNEGTITLTAVAEDTPSANAAQAMKRAKAMVAAAIQVKKDNPHMTVLLQWRGHEVRINKSDTYQKVVDRWCDTKPSTSLNAPQYQGPAIKPLVDFAAAVAAERARLENQR